MRRAVALSTALAIGCVTMASARGDARSTAEVLGPEAGWGDARVELRDVHGLWGGRDVRVRGTGQVVVREVDRTQVETRFEATIPRDEARALLRLAADVDVLNAAVPERAGAPDEARPAIVVGSPVSVDRAVSKWERDPVPAFDRVRAALEALAKRIAAAEQPTFRGAYDRGWRPAGTVQVRPLVYSGRRDPSWELPDDQVAALREKLTGLQPLGREATAELGGFVVFAHAVEGVPETVWVHRGAVGLGERVMTDARGLEGWLREQARARGLPSRDGQR